MQSRVDVFAELRNMLRDMLAATAAGAVHGRIARAHGYVDGYMRALLDLGVASRHELLEVVASERERAGGPAIRVIDLATAQGDTAAA
jgi:hypothetical protein